MKIYMNSQVHPTLRDIINSFAIEALVPVRAMDSDEDFIKSDHCRDCGGEGFFYLPNGLQEKEQCYTCEELHAAEVRADRMMDEAKGN